MNRGRLSVVIITFNEENYIGNCIQSVKSLADEIVVVDSFSNDRTCEIAENMGATVVQHAFEGHIQQKNWAKDQANFDWVLSLDADECLSTELFNSILNIKTGQFSETTIENKPILGYSMNRLNHLGGKPIKGCGWYPDRKLRLWNRRSGHWAGTNPHDRFELKDSFVQKHLDGDILHFTYINKKAVLNQAIKFGNIGAKTLENAFLLTIILKFITSPSIKFLKNYFIRGGFKYGWNGFYICACQWLESFLKYGKGILLNLNNKK
jgi:glycosyltransferase involved in cell wall biosynthesis